MFTTRPAPHYILKHPPANATLRVTVAYHNRDLKRRTLDSILKQAGLSPEEFRRVYKESALARAQKAEE